MGAFHSISRTYRSERWCGTVDDLAEVFLETHKGLDDLKTTPTGFSALPIKVEIGDDKHEFTSIQEFLDHEFTAGQLNDAWGISYGESRDEVTVYIDLHPRPPFRSPPAATAQHGPKALVVAAQAAMADAIQKRERPRRAIPRFSTWLQLGGAVLALIGAISFAAVSDPTVRVAGAVIVLIGGLMALFGRCVRGTDIPMEFLPEEGAPDAYERALTTFYKRATAPTVVGVVLVVLARLIA